jgi:hypothetical protein
MQAGDSTAGLLPFVLSTLLFMPVGLRLLGAEHRHCKVTTWHVNRLSKSATVGTAALRLRQQLACLLANNRVGRDGLAMFFPAAICMYS